MVCERHHTIATLSRNVVFAIEKVADSFDVFATDATTKLVELCESEILRIRDEDRIGSEKTHTILDNSRGEENIEFHCLECMNTVLDLFWLHLAMRGDDARRFFSLSSEFVPEHFYFMLHLFDTANTVMEDEYLSSSFEFIAYRGINGRCIPRRDDGADRFPHIGSSRQHRNRLESGECEIEAPRNRCRREHQDIDMGLEFLETLFMFHSEAVFFIDNEESESSKVDIIRKKSVSPDHDIDRAVSQSCDHAFCLFG